MASRFLKASSQTRSDTRFHAGPASGVYRPSDPTPARELPPIGETSAATPGAAGFDRPGATTPAGGLR
jgi:hypothetical protein